MIKILNNIAASIGWMIIALMFICFVMISIGLFGVFRGQSVSLVNSERAVAVVELSGQILTSKEFRKALNKQTEDDDIQAIVVRIDSPGGAVGASEEIFRAIKLARNVKPVVCSLGSIAASGGLYAAVGCDKIVSNQGTLTGSIGVVMMLPSVVSLANKIGFEMRVIKSGELKDAGSPFRSMSENDAKALQRVVDIAYKQFVSVVADSRGVPMDEVLQYADGRIITGQEALDLGLVDAIGGVDEAAKLALEIKGIDGVPDIIFPKKSKRLMGLIDDILEGRVTGVISSPGLRYQWF